MTREQYLELRNQNKLDYGLFYEYYTTHCKEPLVKSLEEFIPLFTQFINTFVGMNTELVLKYFDNKFEVISIFNNRTGEIVKYV